MVQDTEVEVAAVEALVAYADRSCDSLQPPYRPRLVHPLLSDVAVELLQLKGNITERYYLKMFSNPT